MNISSVSNINFQSSKVKAFLWANNAATPPCFDNEDKKHCSQATKVIKLPTQQTVALSEKEFSHNEAAIHADTLKSNSIVRRNLIKQKLAEYEDFYNSFTLEDYYENGTVKMRYVPLDPESSEIIEKIDQEGTITERCEIIKDSNDVVFEITEFCEDGKKNFHQFVNGKIQASFIGLDRHSNELEIAYDENEEPLVITEGSFYLNHLNLRYEHLFGFKCTFDNGKLVSVKELSETPTCERNVVPRYDVYKF